MSFLVAGDTSRPARSRAGEPAVGEPHPQAAEVRLEGGDLSAETGWTRPGSCPYLESLRKAGRVGRPASQPEISARARMLAPSAGLDGVGGGVAMSVLCVQEPSRKDAQRSPGSSHHQSRPPGLP